MNRKTGKTFLLQWLQERFINLLFPFIRCMAEWNINPNIFTFLGAMITSLGAAVIVYCNSIRMGGVLFLAGGLCDIIDGNLARHTGRSTKFGALLDSSIDRYSELIMFFSIALYYMNASDLLLVSSTLVAATGSMMVSYVRARAEGLGFTAKIGFMQRPERIILISCGALVSDVVLAGSIFVVAVFANYTAIHRIIHVYRQDKILSGTTNTHKPRNNR